LNNWGWSWSRGAVGLNDWRWSSEGLNDWSWSAVGLDGLHLDDWLDDLTEDWSWDWGWRWDWEWGRRDFDEARLTSIAAAITGITLSLLWQVFVADWDTQGGTNHRKCQ